jgi:hypothetical protein
MTIALKLGRSGYYVNIIRKLIHVKVHHETLDLSLPLRPE